MRFLGHIALVSVIWLAAAYPTRLIWTELRITSLAGSALMAGGAYCFALVRLAGYSVPAAILSALGLGIVSGTCIVMLRLRLAGNGLALATFAVQVLVQTWITMAGSITRGPLGLTGIDVGVFKSTLFQWGLVAGTAVFGLLMHAVLSSRLSLTSLRILGRSPELGITLGMPPMIPLVVVGAYYGVTLSGAGVALCVYYKLAEPNMFQLGQSMSILAISAFGRRRLAYLPLGVFVVVALPELTRLFGVDSLRAGYLQLLLSGITLAWVALAANDDVLEGKSE